MQHLNHEHRSRLKAVLPWLLSCSWGRLWHDRLVTIWQQRAYPGNALEVFVALGLRNMHGERAPSYALPILSSSTDDLLAATVVITVWLVLLRWEALVVNLAMMPAG